ncbi:MAG: hypothetical protein E7287_09650 [Lachnospiraceae bacterium]|nr:hypothetical protein [Lachnospiraceae bacterium]
MKKQMRKKGILMSVFMGAIMGLVFTIFAQIKNQGRIIPMGIVISILISMVISLLVGLIIPVRKVTEATCKLLKISPDKRLVVGLASAFVFNLIFTPPNCCINMWYGMAMGLQDVPPTVTNVFQKMAFCAGLEYFVPALISTLLIDLVIGFFLTFFASPFVNKLTDKMCGIKRA